MGLRIRGKVSDEAYEKQLALVQVERRWIQEYHKRLKADLVKLQNQSVSLVGLE